MAATGPNFIDFVSELVYGDLGVGELGTAPPAGAKNHIHWTRDNIPNSVATTVTGDAFLAHHLDYMLARYEAWRSKYFLPPLRPWDGQSPMDGEQSASVPGDGPLPATTEALGTSIREYYNSTYRAGLTDELADEVKAAYSYRYWAFVKWASDLRKRVLGQPVIHVHKVFDRDGTVLSEKDFTDIFHQVHHVWHPDGRSAAVGRSRRRSSGPARASTSASGRSAARRSGRSSFASTAITSRSSTAGSIEWHRTGSCRSTPAPTTPILTTHLPPAWMPISPGIRTSRTGPPTRRPSTSPACTRPTGKAM